MARLSRTQIVAVASVPVVVVLISLGVTAFRGRTRGPVEPRTGDGAASSSVSTTTDGLPGLAITPEKFDGMGRILDGLGEGFRHRTLAESALRDPKWLAKVQALFLTCAKGENEAEAAAMGQNLRDYVSGGGTLYASDLRYDTIAEAFPDLVDPASRAQGLRQEVVATVVSPELRAVVGGEIPLHFELDGWRPAAFRGEDVEVLIKGKLKTTAGITIEAPLLVKFPFGKGTVIFTSFHHAKKNSKAEIKLLNHLGLKTVLAGLEAREVDAMAGDGLAAKATTAMGVDLTVVPATLSYDLARVGPIRFRLGAGRAGSRFRLEVVSPKGEKFSKRGEPGATLDIPAGAPGRWEYRLVPEAIPYPGFPTLLLVGTQDRSDGSLELKGNRALDLPSGNVQFVEVSLANKETSSNRAPRIAVSERPAYDDMGVLLAKLGRGFQYTKVTMDDLLQPDALDSFDIFFLTCDAWPGTWALAGQKTRTERQGVVLGRVDEQKMRQSGDTVRRFVERGGTLYASDLRIDVVNKAFPGRAVTQGDSETLPPTKREIGLNVGVLPKLMQVERAWLDIVAPSGHVPTVLETLQEAKLSLALAEQLDQLVAAVELSGLIKSGLNDPRANPREMVRGLNLFLKSKLPMTEADLDAVATAMSGWEAKIHNGFRKQASSKTKDNKARAEAELQDLRGRMIVNTGRGTGDQVVPARIDDPGLRELLGVPELALTFNNPGWWPARFRGDVDLLLVGDYLTDSDARFEVPLLVKFQEGQGTVIFTSFHNEAQNNQQEEALLRYLVFKAVTAKEDANADAMMLKGGFSTAKKSQLNHKAGNDSIAKIYNHPGAGPLRFALVFTGAGARLKLTIVAPGGQKYEQVTESTLIVEASGASPGEWVYSVEAIKVPYENFPFGVSIGTGDVPPRRP